MKQLLTFWADASDGLICEVCLCVGVLGAGGRGGGDCNGVSPRASWSSELHLSAEA